MEYLGLFFEMLFLAFGVYIYLFSTGKMTVKDPDKKAKAEAFRKDNASWMRIASIALVAIMLINIYIHITQILG